MKPMLIILKVCVIIGVVLIMLFGISWLCLYLGLKFSKDPLTPTQTYGEFPYKIVYEIDGEINTIEGKFICKYEGISINEGRGKYRVWSGFIDGTEETSVLLFQDDKVKIYCYIGDAGYYMNDIKYSGHNVDSPLEPRLFCKPQKEELDKMLSESEIVSQYKIKIIEWEFADPITNSFN